VSFRNCTLSRVCDNDLALLEAGSEAGSIEAAEQDGEAEQDEKAEQDTKAEQDKKAGQDLEWLSRVEKVL